MIHVHIIVPAGVRTSSRGLAYGRPSILRLVKLRK
jgi:hypothetical protein